MGIENIARKLDQGHKNLGEIIKMSNKGIIKVHKKFAHNPNISKYILRNVICNFVLWLFAYGSKNLLCWAQATREQRVKADTTNRKVELFLAKETSHICPAVTICQAALKVCKISK